MLRYIADTVHSFDSEQNFTDAEFIFDLPDEFFDNLTNVLQDAELIVDKALLRVYNNNKSSELFDIIMDVNANG